MPGIKDISKTTGKFGSYCDECAAKLCIPKDNCPCECHTSKPGIHFQDQNIDKSRKAAILGDYIEKSLEDKLRFQMTSSPGKFNAGDLGLSPRMLLIKYLGIYRDQALLQNVRYMENGTKGHERWQSWLQRSGLLLEAESYMVHEQYNIRGKLDFVIRHPQLQRILLELKTTGSEKIKAMKIPDPEHIAQWTFYSDRRGIQHGFIVYEDRESVTPTYFPLERVGADLTIFSPNGGAVKEITGYVNQMYKSVEFVIWCSQSNSYPFEMCTDCSKYGCKQKETCKNFAETRKPISFEEWAKR